MKATFVKHFSWLWNNAEKILIFLFFATFPFNVRKVFLTDYSYLNGEYNEYLTPSFTWADFLIILLIIIYIIKYLVSQYKQGWNSSPSPTHQKATGKSSDEWFPGLRCGVPLPAQAGEESTHRNQVRCHALARGASQENKFDNMSNSNYFSPIVSRFYNTIIHSIRQLLSRGVAGGRHETFLLFIFLAWVTISIIWSPLKEIAVFKAASVIEVVIIAFIAIEFTRQNPLGSFLIKLALIVCGTFQAIIAVSQFILNRSLGLQFLGESILGPQLPGVAKFAVESVKHIRGYGTFSHPNILAGFLLIPIFILVGLLVENRQKRETRFRVSHESFQFGIPAPFLVLLLVILLIGLLITFSRSAILAFAVGAIIFWWQKSKALYFRQNFLRLILFIAALFLIIYVVSHTNLNFILDSQSLHERIFYTDVSRDTIASYTLQGVGIGQFVQHEYQKYPDLPGWQYQPVHNIYLLVASEIGLIGLCIFLLFLVSFYVNNFPKKGEQISILTLSCICIIICFLLIALFDHYFWSFKLGMIIFSIPFILLLANGQEKCRD